MSIVKKLKKKKNDVPQHPLLTQHPLPPALLLAFPARRRGKRHKI